MFDFLIKAFIDSGNAIASTWISVFVVVSALMIVSRLFVKVHNLKIQKRKYDKSTFCHEIMWSAFNLGITAFVLTQLSAYLVDAGYMKTNTEPASWYIIAYEFLLYFFIFDLYFYTAHRLIHIEPLYTWIHKTHHYSLSPNPLSSSSMTPVEGIIEGLIIPIYLTVFTVHEASSYLIIPFATIMGLYVHCGYEFVPRWWYKNPLTSWFITPMFHDQHHQYFTCNYGGYTTIWDKVFGTVRPRFESDFDRLKSRNDPKPELQTG